jgi:preprotein translocase subunit SecE
MTTPLPSWAYVWGRYLSVVLISLGLAVELLIAIVAVAMVMHLTVAGDVYPTPQLDKILIVWASFVLPIVFFFGSLSFALGTLWPRRSNLLRTGLLIVWFVMGFILLAALNSQLASWDTNWDPTGGNINEGSPDRYRSVYIHQLHAAGLYHVHQTAATNAWALQALHTLEYHLVDFWSWFGPHLIWDGLALVIVILAAVTFRRFRTVFGA